MLMMHIDVAEPVPVFVDPQALLGSSSKVATAVRGMAHV